MAVGKELARCKLEVLGLQVVRCGVNVTHSYLTIMHLRNLEQRVVRD